MVITACIASDWVLFTLGIGGFGKILERVPQAITWVTIGGIIFLVVYGGLSARRALRGSAGLLAEEETSAPKTQSKWQAVAAVLTLTWLNPHVYLDTVVLTGSIASSYGPERWVYGAGAALASLVWFLALGYGSRLLSPLFAKPFAWRVLDGGIAALMFLIAGGLLLGL